jgi:hypothetical protein
VALADFQAADGLELNLKLLLGSEQSHRKVLANLLIFVHQQAFFQVKNTNPLSVNAKTSLVGS